MTESMKSITGLITIPVATDVDHQLYDPIMPKGSMVIKDGKILITENSSRVSGMSDHKHPNLANAAHTHIAGANIPWMMSNAKLWYISDLTNHPELVPLDGRELSDEDASALSNIYYGNRSLTEPVTLTDNVYTNDEATLSVTSFTAYNTPDKLFGEAVTIDNGFDFRDQWLSGNGNLDGEQTVTVTFKGTNSYRLMSYYLVPASGTPTAEVTKAPTPNTWVLEGYSEATSEWVVLDSQSNVTDWNVLQTKMFDISDEITTLCTAIRIRITVWNAGADVGNGVLSTGLRRFWMFGRKNGYFSVPDIPSPDDEFTWVVPKSNLNVGLKHEDVGDIGLTAVKDSLRPNYRLACDGTAKSAADYGTLSNVILGKYDPINTAAYMQSASGTIDGTSYTCDDAAVWVQYQLARSEVLSKYVITSTDTKTPVSWSIEGLSNGSWTTLHSVTDLAGVTSTVTNGTTVITADLTGVLNLAAYSTIRINVIDWSDTDAASAGYTNIQFFSHPAGQFYLPNLGADYYIVSDVSVTDVSASIISSLQQNIADLAATVAALQQQVNTLTNNS